MLIGNKGTVRKNLLLNCFSFQSPAKPQPSFYSEEKNVASTEIHSEQRGDGGGAGGGRGREGGG